MKKYIFYTLIYSISLLSFSYAISLHDYLNSYLVKNELTLPKEIKNSSTSNKFTPEDKKMMAFYEKLLKIKKPKWTKITLAPQHIFPSKHQNLAPYNKHIFWDKKSGYRIRPIYTFAGCSSKCSDIVFHLVFNKRLKFLKILQEDSIPLTKIHHKKLSPKDIHALVKALNNIPNLIKNTISPDQLTENNLAYPPHTWSFFRPYVIKGGAYTSFRVLQAGLSTVNAIKNLPSVNKQAAAQEIVRNLLYNNDLKDLHLHFKRYRQQLYSNNEDSSVKMLLGRWLPYVASWILENNSVPKSVQRNIEALFNHPFYASSYVNDFCRFLTRLSPRSKSANKFLRNLHHYKRDSKCHSPKLWIREMLAAHTLKDTKWINKLLKNPIKDEIEKNLIGIHPQLLRDITIVYKSLKMIPSAHKVESYLSYQYPKFPYKKIKIDKKLKAEIKLSIKRNLHNQISSETPKVFPKLKILNSSNTLPVFNKQIYIFVSPYCPYCQKTVAAIQNSKLSTDNKNKIVFIDVTGSKDTNKSCKLLGLKRCSKLKSIDLGESSNLSKLGLFSVPKLVVTDSYGKIRINDLDIHLDTIEYRDFNRELNIIFDKINHQKIIAQ